MQFITLHIHNKRVTLNHKDISILIQNVCLIAKDAGKAILEVYNSEDFEVEQKQDNSPLTKADKLANDIIINGLQQINADIPIISEEIIPADYHTRSQYEYYWLVDPLDGTKEFIKRNGDFTVNIALIHNQKSIAGVVYIPVQDINYWAIEGLGSYKIHQNSTEKIFCNHITLSDSGIRVACSRSHLNEATQQYINQLYNPVLIQKGSSLKFTIIAEGNADIYPRMGPTMEWDTAAAQIILEEAGGSLIDLSTLKPIKYNKENLYNPHFIAYANIKNNSC